MEEEGGEGEMEMGVQGYLSIIYLIPKPNCRTFVYHTPKQSLLSCRQILPNLHRYGYMCMDIWM